MSEVEIPEGFIDVTGVPLESIIRAAYNLSRQQGLGLFDAAGRHAITAKAIEEIIENGKKGPRCNAISMDYVNGRSVKMTVCKFGDKLAIGNKWFDHTEEDLSNLLAVIIVSKFLAINGLVSTGAGGETGGSDDGSIIVD